MRKVRDFDGELKALNERTKLLKQRKVQQFGELIEATGADALAPDLLAGALLAAVEEADANVMTKWSSRGAEFFREANRRPSRGVARNGARSTAAKAGTEPA